MTGEDLWLKPESEANRVREVEPAYTECRAVLERDYNAAMNILQRGLELLALLPVERREVTPVEIECRSKQELEAAERVR